MLSGNRDRRILPLGLLLAIAVAGTYADSFDGAMLLDDNLIVAASQTTGTFSLKESLDSGRPLTDATFAINHAIHGLKPWGYHAVNLVIHILATLVLFGLIRRAMECGNGDDDSRHSAVWIAFVGSLIWGVHPLQTESVTYIIQRSESLMGFFYLLVLYCVVRKANSPGHAGWTLAAIFACALGVCSKPVMVTAPVAVLLFDRAYLADSWKSVFTRRWKLHAGLFATLSIFLVTGVFRSVVTAASDREATVGFAVSGLSPLTYLLTQAGVIVHYLRLAIWPDALCLDYQWPIARSVVEAGWPLAVIGAALLASIVAYCIRPRLGFLGIAFFLVLLPTSSFVPIKDVIFEHRVYLPLASLSILGVLLVRGVLQTACELNLLLPSARKPIAAGLLIIITAALIARTWERNRDYHDAISMWSSIATRYPDHARAQNNLAVAYYDAEQYSEAVPHFEAAIRLEPGNTKARTNLAQTLEKLGKNLAAAQEYGKTAELLPESWTAAFNHGNEFFEAGRDQEAIEALKSAKSIDPTEIEAYIVTGNALTRMIRHDEAIAEYQDGIQLAKPSTPPDVLAKAYFNLANTLAKRSRRIEAIDAYHETIKLDPQHFAAYYGLGWSLQMEDRIPEAIDAYKASLAINPDYVPALKGLETLLRLQSGGS